MVRSFFRVFGALVLLGVVAEAAVAQSVQIRTLETRPEGVVFEVTAQWPVSLRARLDSAQATVLDASTALKAARSQLVITEAVRLPALANPRVQILSAEFDEVALPAAADAGEVVASLDQAPAEAVGVGLERKQPVATLVARLLTYDAAQGTLRRYRRLVVAVEYPPRASGRRFHTFGFSDNPHLAVSRSALADDALVFKIPVSEAGIYRIDRQVLGGLPGVDPSSIDPNNVKILGNGGAPVPALNSAPRLADLAENPVLVRGGGDGSFDNNDAVLFYAAAPEGWQVEIQRDSQGNARLDGNGNPIRAWEHYVHPFSTVNYYFIKIDGTPNTRLEPTPFPGFSDATVQTQIEGRYFRDFEDFMWSREDGTGHTWVSNVISLDGGELDLLDGVTLPGFQGGLLRYEVRTAAQDNPAPRVFLTSNGTQMAEVRYNPISNSAERPIADARVTEFEQTLAAGQALDLTMRISNPGRNPKGAADWVRVFYPKALTPTDGVLRFHTPLAETGRYEFVLSGFSQPPEVWDITRPDAIRKLTVQASGGTHRVQVEATDLDTPRELIAFAQSAVRPLDVSACDDAACRVAPQNLHGLAEFPDFVIVTPEIFRPFAEDLAERRRQDGLVVVVADVEAIYNEFSGGLQDPRAYRDYFKFLYDRAPDEERMLRYALFFGDGHFDYRNIEQSTALENWVLPFETEESFDPDASFTSDDYFGLLDDEEGLWYYRQGTWPVGEGWPINERVDIGIGRFTVQTADEAAAVVRKIERYESPATYGPWRLRYLFVADDALTGGNGNTDESDLHTQNIDVVASLISDIAPEIVRKKVYGISYDRVYRGEWRLPQARQDILSAINNGVLVVNYAGHGGEETLAQEDIFTAQDAIDLRNAALPVFVTATCSFGRWDLATFQSGAEELLINPDGGAIAMMTTVRTVYTSGSETTLNVGLNMELNRQLFKREENNLPVRLGDALRRTKNQRVGYEGNNRKFNLLGDPTMRLGLPAHRAVVETVNGVAVAQEQAAVRALDRITITGAVQTPEGAPLPEFNGAVNISVFDAERRVSLPVRFYMPTPYYIVREDLIWRGKVNATNGQFSASFVVPKDISYSDEPGHISVYAASDERQAHGWTNNIVVGGTSDNPPDDSEGPEVELFLDDESFVSGGLTSPRPRVLVKIFDETGVNTAGAGVGHEMLLVLDGDEQNAIDIGALYESDENAFQRGSVTFEFDEDLSPGPHTLEVRVWDVLNNSGGATIDFVVSEAEALRVERVFNYPNPTTGRTRFVFEHNQPVGTPARVRVRVYTLNGLPIRTIEQEEVLTGGPVQIAWDGRDDDFDRLAPGVYLYKVRIEVDGADGDRQVSEHIETLAVIR